MADLEASRTDGGNGNQTGVIILAVKIRKFEYALLWVRASLCTVFGVKHEALITHLARIGKSLRLILQDPWVREIVGIVR